MLSRHQPSCFNPIVPIQWNSFPQVMLWTCSIKCFHLRRFASLNYPIFFRTCPHNKTTLEPPKKIPRAEVSNFGMGHIHIALNFTRWYDDLHQCESNGANTRGKSVIILFFHIRTTYTYQLLHKKPEWVKINELQKSVLNSERWTFK